MYYNLTLLKDLPEYPAGTEFMYFKGRCCGFYSNTMVIESRIGVLKNGKAMMSTRFPFPEKIIDDPAWFKKEVNYTYLKDFKCPKCGGTQFYMFKHAYRMGDPEDGFWYKTDLYLKCPCGEEMKL